MLSSGILWSIQPVSVLISVCTVVVIKSGECCFHFNIRIQAQNFFNQTPQIGHVIISAHYSLECNNSLGYYTNNVCDHLSIEYCRWWWRQRPHLSCSFCAHAAAAAADLAAAAAADALVILAGAAAVAAAQNQHLRHPPATNTSDLSVARLTQSRSYLPAPPTQKIHWHCGFYYYMYTRCHTANRLSAEQGPPDFSGEAWPLKRLTNCAGAVKWSLVNPGSRVRFVLAAILRRLWHCDCRMVLRLRDIYDSVLNRWALSAGKAGQWTLLRKKGQWKVKNSRVKK